MSTLKRTMSDAQLLKLEPSHSPLNREDAHLARSSAIIGAAGGLISRGSSLFSNADPRISSFISGVSKFVAGLDDLYGKVVTGHADTTLPVGNYGMTGPALGGPSHHTSLPLGAQLAEQSVLSGYLFKLGVNVRRWKRRFFVLQPTTMLYYYLSPGGQAEVDSRWWCPSLQMIHNY